MENIFSIRLRPCIGRMQDRWGIVQEIRLRANQPLLIKMDGKEWMIHKNGSLCKDKGEAVRVFQQDIQEIYRKFPKRFLQKQMKMGLFI